MKQHQDLKDCSSVDSQIGVLGSTCVLSRGVWLAFRCQQKPEYLTNPPQITLINQHSMTRPRSSSIRHRPAITERALKISQLAQIGMTAPMEAKKSRDEIVSSQKNRSPVTTSIEEKQSGASQ